MKLPTSTYEYGTHLIFVTINYTGGTSSEVNAEIRINGSTVIGSATTNATASKNTLTFFTVINNNCCVLFCAATNTNTTNCCNTAGTCAPGLRARATRSRMKPWQIARAKPYGAARIALDQPARRKLSCLRSNVELSGDPLAGRPTQTPG